MWEKRNYARIEIPEEDADKIRESLRVVLKGKRAGLTQDQKKLLAKLHNHLGILEVITHAGKPVL